MFTKSLNPPQLLSSRVTPTPSPSSLSSLRPTPSPSPTAARGGTPPGGVDRDLFHNLIEQNGVPNGVSDATSYRRDLQQGEIAYTNGESFDERHEFQTVMNLNGTNTLVSEPSSADDRNGTTTIAYIFMGAGHVEVTNFTPQVGVTDMGSFHEG